MHVGQLPGHPHGRFRSRKWFTLLILIVVSCSSRAAMFTGDTGHYGRVQRREWRSSASCGD